MKASWRSGYAEDCKSLHPGSIPGEASTHRHPGFTGFFGGIWRFNPLLGRVAYVLCKAGLLCYRPGSETA